MYVFVVFGNGGGLLFVILHDYVNLRVCNLYNPYHTGRSQTFESKKSLTVELVICLRCFNRENTERSHSSEKCIQDEDKIQNSPKLSYTGVRLCCHAMRKVNREKSYWVP